MPQRPKTFNPGTEDPEATLVSPRFDADDARRAHPVVPLAEVPARHAPRARRVRIPRRGWTPALLAVALLAAAALGGAVATKLTQGPRPESAQEQAPPAPVQAAEAPPQPATTAAAGVAREETTDAPREDAPARPAPRDARPRRAKATTTATLAEPEREEVGDYERRDKRAEKRREREDEVEKEMRKQMEKAMKRARGKAPRLVDVLTPSEQ